MRKNDRKIQGQETVLTVPDLIRTARGDRIQEDFAVELKVSQPQLCKYEKGKANPPRRVIEKCMQIVRGGVETAGVSAEDLAHRIKLRLKGPEQATARLAVAQLIDCLGK